MAFLHLKKLQFGFTHAGCKQIIALDSAIQDLVSDHFVNRTLPEQTFGEIGDGVLEKEEDDESIFVLTDEWKEFFAKSEAKRKLGTLFSVSLFSTLSLHLRKIISAQLFLVRKSLPLHLENIDLY